MVLASALVLDTWEDGATCGVVGLFACLAKGMFLTSHLGLQVHPFLSPIRGKPLGDVFPTGHQHQALLEGRGAEASRLRRAQAVYDQDHQGEIH